MSSCNKLEFQAVKKALEVAVYIVLVKTLQGNGIRASRGGRVRSLHSKHVISSRTTAVRFATATLTSSDKGRLVECPRQGKASALQEGTLNSVVCLKCGLGISLRLQVPIYTSTRAICDHATRSECRRDETQPEVGKGAIRTTVQRLDITSGGQNAQRNTSGCDSGKGVACGVESLEGWSARRERVMGGLRADEIRPTLDLMSTLRVDVGWVESSEWSQASVFCARKGVKSSCGKKERLNLIFGRIRGVQCARRCSGENDECQQCLMVRSLCRGGLEKERSGLKVRGDSYTSYRGRQCSVTVARNLLLFLGDGLRGDEAARDVEGNIDAGLKSSTKRRYHQRARVFLKGRKAAGVGTDFHSYRYKVATRWNPREEGLEKRNEQDTEGRGQIRLGEQSMRKQGGLGHGRVQRVEGGLSVDREASELRGGGQSCGREGGRAVIYRHAGGRSWTAIFLREGR
ncbi:hypothetical protein EDD18DRAFT_1101019 [Armillaria luteobubalina]|uniref:Uncharacterized protein n=1 Tax=Armillaria luteobubalina TaxID=153913 RepID=A0AA39QIT7_9AGAR|nr:hypothetical protein EDD18DRAFT_1101019 [Armillaria luteobubalina]